MKHLIRTVAAVSMLTCFSTAQAIVLDVYDSTDPNNYQLLGQITTIDTAQSGAQHYNYYSASAHPSGVPLAGNALNIWVHNDTNNSGSLSFGLVFGKDNSGSPWASSTANFRIVDSATDVYVSQSDDPGEAVETGPGAFEGTFNYSNNTDGIMVSGLSGNDWTIIVDAVDLGPYISKWNVVSGDGANFSTVAGDFTLTSEIRITLADVAPDDDSVTVPAPSGALILLSGLLLAAFRRRS